MPDITLTQADNGAALEITPGSRILLQLAENPTTGYVWAVDELDQQVLTVEDSSISLAPDPQVGGGGNRILTFRAVAPGAAHLRLKLWREWQGDTSVMNRFEAAIQVRD